MRLLKYMTAEQIVIGVALHGAKSLKISCEALRSEEALQYSLEMPNYWYCRVQITHLCHF